MRYLCLVYYYQHIHRIWSINPNTALYHLLVSSKRLNVKNNHRGPCFLNTFLRKQDPISDILSIELFVGRQVRAPFPMINGLVLPSVI